MSFRSIGCRLAALSLFASLFVVSPVLGWGCKGHQTVALIAEKHLGPQARQLLETLLKENPIDPQLKRYCGPFPSSLLADSSTWPDDVRNTLKNGPWHYIDIPRGAPRAPLATFCGEAGCVTQAIAEQLAILKDPQADPHKRADAARYVIHFVGDLHMPLTPQRTTMKAAIASPSASSAATHASTTTLTLPIFTPFGIPRFSNAPWRVRTPPSTLS